MIRKPQGGRLTVAALAGALALACVAPAVSAECRVDVDCGPPEAPWPTSTPGSQDVLRGQFKFQDLRAARPIAGATVEVWTEEPRGILGLRTWAKRHTARTGSDGSLEVRFSHQGGVNVKYALRLFATNEAAKVMPGTDVDVTPFYVEPSVVGGSNHYVARSSGVADFTTTFTDYWTAGRFNVADAMLYGRRFAIASRAAGEAESIAQITVQVNHALTDVSRHAWFLWWREIQMMPGHLFNDHVVLHEYGHHLQNTIAFLGTGGPHDGCRFEFGSTPMRAFQEAWASAFADAVLMQNPEIVEQRFGQEFPEHCRLPPGDTVEAHVRGALYDLLDTSNESGDSFQWNDLIGNRPLNRVLVEIVDKELDAPDRGIMDFRAALIGRGIDKERLDDLLRHNLVIAPPSAPPGPVEPADPPADEPAFCRVRPWLCDGR